MKPSLCILIVLLSLGSVARAADDPATQAASSEATPADVLFLDVAKTGIDAATFSPLRVRNVSLPAFDPEEATRTALHGEVRRHQPRVLLLALSPDSLHAFGETKEAKAEALRTMLTSTTARETKTEPAESNSPTMRTVLLLASSPDTPAGKYAAAILDATVESAEAIWLWADDANLRVQVLLAYRHAGGERIAPKRIDPPLRDGETLLFLGDSITNQQIPAGGFVGRVERALRTTERSIKVQRVAINGARAETFTPDVLRRQVLRWKPAVTVVYLGTADALAIQDAEPTASSPSDFRATLQHLVGSLQQAGSRVVLVTPAVIGENVLPSRAFDQTVDAFAEAVREVAFLRQCPVADVRARFWVILRENNIDREVKGILTRDGVHLNEAGQKIVAEELTRILAPSSANSVSD